MPDEPTSNCLLSSIVTFLGGGFVGTWLGHFLAVGRDSRNRKHADEAARKIRINEFKGVMSGFRSWVERSPFELGDEFGNRVHGIRQETAKIRDDLLPENRAQFDEAVTNLCRLSNIAVSEYASEGNNKINHMGQTLVCTMIDRLVETVG